MAEQEGETLQRACLSRVFVLTHIACVVVNSHPFLMLSTSRVVGVRRVQVDPFVVEGISVYELDAKADITGPYLSTGHRVGMYRALRRIGARRCVGWYRTLHRQVAGRSWAGSRHSVVHA
eukprot:3423185-Rhodomonas_salina.1